MLSDRIYKVGGPALFIGGILVFVTALYGDVAFEGFRSTHAMDSLWGLVNLLSLIGAILLVLGFTTAYVRQANPTGALGLWGWALTTTAGMLFGVVIATISLIVIPILSPADQKLFDFGGSAPPPQGLAIFFLVATVVFVVGTILFGLATNRAKVFASWTGSALMASGILAVVSTVIRLAVPGFSPVVADVPYLLFFATVGAMGYWLGMQDKAMVG